MAIETNLHMQVMGCSVCGEQHEVPQRLLRDQDGLLQLREDVERDHRECVEYSDLRLAINARAVRKRIEEELAKRRSLPVKPQRRWAA